MNSDIHFQAQTTKKYDLPLSHLEYSYIEKCSNVKELEKILRILRSGEEGRYIDLENFCEKRLQTLNPKSRVLRKDEPILRPSDIGSGDWKTIEDDLQNWSSDMQKLDSNKHKKPFCTAEADLNGENIPPVRGDNIVLEGNVKKANTPKKNSRVLPRDYKEWDKFDINAELDKVDNTEKVSTQKEKSTILSEIDSSGMTNKEKELKATREKEKGNEAFRSKDFEESVTYYSRSISLLPISASYNNRALAYLKLEKWDKAIADCNMVLKAEINNIKALLRRGTAYKSKGNHETAMKDFLKVLELEPHNKKAEDLLDDIKKEMTKNGKEKEKGRRMVIEEVDDGNESEELENIELEKPMFNGINKSNHVSSSVTTKPSLIEHTEKQNEKECSAPTSIQSSVVEKPAAPSKVQDGTELSNLNKPSLPVSPADESNKSHKPDVSFSLESTENGSVEDTIQDSSNKFSRPVFIQSPLPESVQSIKAQGNELFRCGQYGNALELYSSAISELSKGDEDQRVNLSVLLNNRSACYLKIGSCSEAISDCNESLNLLPHNTKALLRRAAAFEAKEKYGEAYVDYKHVLSIDCAVEQAKQGFSRCQSALQTRHGLKSWRSKLPPMESVQPWEVPEIVDSAGMHRSLSSTVSLSDASTSQSGTKEKPSTSVSKQDRVEKSTPVPDKAGSQPVVAANNEDNFEQVKARGNEHVKKAQYTEAVVCYSTCLSQYPDHVACYTNRALCYLKLNKPFEAESDCDRALTLQPSNPKALYRRALSRKDLEQYKSSLQDLVELLKLEPKNSAAIKEMEVVKKLYKEELEKLKKVKKQDQESKVRKRMKIEEVDDDEEEDKPRSKLTEKVKPMSKLRNSKGQLTSNNKSKETDKKTGCTTGQPVAPPSAPRLMKTTPYEFCQAWNSLKPCQGTLPYAELLKQIAPNDLPSVISNKLDGQMLQIIVRCVNEELVLKGGDYDQGYKILYNLCKVPRFSTVSMFMSSKEKKEVSCVLEQLVKNHSSGSQYSKQDIQHLKKEYSVK